MATIHQREVARAERQTVLALVEKHSGETTAQLAARLDMPRYHVRQRLNELRADKLVHSTRSGKGAVWYYGQDEER